MRSKLGKLVDDSRGAVAPTVALALFALIASGGIAFDYARLSAMDTELQDAADQAALAAATQLDRTEDSQTHATTAISDPTVTNRLAANLTKFANDGSSDGVSVEIENITFCSAFDDTKPDTADMLDSSGGPCTEAEDGTDSYYVIVRTSARTAEYALTPVVAAFSGTVNAMAVAGVQSSVCNIAPLFVCTEDVNFPTDADIGKGLKMKTGGGNSWAPGNYGLLDFTGGAGGGGNNAAQLALLGHGLNGCLATNDVETEPGNKNVTDAINTRMDVYADSPLSKDPSICVSGGDGYGCPAKNVRKDMIISIPDKNPPEIRTTTPTPPTQTAIDAAAPTCPANPQTDNKLAFAKPASPVKGFERDTCHYNNSCGNFGNGTWDFAGYMAANHPTTPTTDIPHVGPPGTTPTRFEVYTWELGGPIDPADANYRRKTKRFASVDPTPKVSGPPSNRRYDWTIRTQCSYPDVKYGKTNYAPQKDRRILPVVAANCDLLNGSGNIGEDFKLIRVFDVFLTEPSVERTSYPGPTDNKEIYGEIIGPAETFGSGSGLQYYSRNRPYLVR